MYLIIGRPIHAEQRTTVLPDDAKTVNDMIIHLVEDNLFEDEGDVRIFLRKHQAHQLTPKGRYWELADDRLNLRSPGPRMDKAEREDGALVLDWVVSDKEFAIVLMDDGIKERGFVLGTITRYFLFFCFVCSHLRSRHPEIQQEDEQECPRASADVSDQRAVRLRNRRYSGHRTAQR
jgi:hypothetical protein